MFDIDKAATRHNLQDWFFWVCCSSVECHIFSLLISLLQSYFIAIIMTITGMFMSIAINFELPT